MEKTKRQRLEAGGWAVGDAAEFLNLSPAEVEFLELRFELAKYFRRLRTGADLTQTQAAKQLRSSQSRVAKMELADKSVSMDLLIRSILGLGGTREMVAAAICR